VSGVQAAHASPSFPTKPALQMQRLIALLPADDQAFRGHEVQFAADSEARTAENFPEVHDRHAAESNDVLK
jgi:hypothetical protein